MRTILAPLIIGIISCLVFTPLLHAAAPDADTDPCMDTWEQIDDLEKEKPELRELLRFARERKNIVKQTHKELAAFSIKMRRELNRNVTKTLMKGWIDLSQDVNSLLSGINITDDIVSWVASKGASLVMSDSGNPIGRAFVGEAYRKKKMHLISTKAKALTPELEKLVQLSNMSMEGMASWFNKYGKHTDELAPGDVALFTNKMRLMNIQAEAACRSLYQLFLTLRNTEKETERQMELTDARLERLKAELDRCRDEKSRKTEKTEVIEPDVPPTVSVEPSDAGDRFAGSAQGFVEENIYKEVIRLHSLQRQVASRIKTAARRQKELYEAVNKSVQEDINDIDGALKQAKKDLDAARKQLYKEDWELVSVKEMERCPGLSVPYKTAIKNNKELHDGYVAINRAYIADLKAAAGLAAEAKQSLAQSEQLADLAKIQGELISLDNAYSVIIRKIRKLNKKPLTNQEVGLSASGFTVFDAVGKLNKYIKGFAYDVADILKKAQSEQHQLDQQIDLFKRSQPLLKPMARECVIRTEAAIEGRIRHAKAAIPLSREYARAGRALKSWYAGLQGQGILEKRKDQYMDFYDLSEAWVENQIDPDQGCCEALESIRMALQPHVDKLRQLESDFTGTRDSIEAVGTPPVIQSNPVAAQNAPGLNSSLLALKPEAEAARRDFRTGEDIRMGTGSSLLSTFDRISRGALQITDIRALKTLNDRQLKTTRDLKKMLKYFNEDLDRLLKRDRIHADAKKNAEATLRRYRAEFERELACLGSEHALVQDVAPLFDPLPGKIAKLGGKDRYADAGPLIQNLRDIKSELEGLGISNDNAYQEQVNTIALKIEAAESRFDGMRPRMHSADIDTVGGLMQEIEGLFAPHGQERQMHQEDQRYAAVENLYRTFAERYSNRDLGGVMACLDDAWHSSGDGTTLMDLEDNLRNSFSMFNEVSFIMEDLSIRRSGYQHFRVKYLVTINGYSYETDITHEETSTVTEIVKVENDRARIVETVNGRYWIRR